MMETPPGKMMQMVTYKLNSGATVWWDQLQHGKGRVRFSLGDG